MARSARDAGVPAAEDTRDPDILTAEELAARLGLDVQTVRDLAGAGVLPGGRAGRRWLFSWAAVYTWIAGPGVPDSEILSTRQLARRIGVDVRVVRRAAAPPGTPGKLPGRQVGKKWLFAIEAVRRELSPPAGRPVGPGTLPVPAAAQPGSPPAG